MSQLLYDLFLLRVNKCDEERFFKTVDFIFDQVSYKINIFSKTLKYVFT